MYETTVEAPSTTYTYEISDATGVVFTSESFSGTAGETISTLPSSLQLDYCNYTVTSTVIANGLGNTVPVTVTYNLPFTVSTDFENATWYYATIRGTKYLRADDNNKDDSGRYTTNSSNEHTDAYKWAFFGNPYTNFYVMNKGQGDGKYMAKQTQIVFRSLTDPTTDNTALWAVTPNSNGGFTLRNIDGGATWYVNDAGGFGNLGFWNSGSGANDAGSNWVITEVPTNPIDVTYELYVGGEKVNTVVDEQVAPNSAVSVPASLTANYSDFAYDIVTSGTIGEDNCTITVTATLKNGIVLPTALSNSKKYRLTTSTRGSLSTCTNEETTYLASPVKSALGISAKDFAIINYEGNYYLYSVDDAKFVTYQSAEIAPLAATVTGTSDAISFSQTTNSVYEIRFDNSASKIINSSASYTYGIVVNSWGASSNQWDDGCQYVIYEVGDFDATDALAALEEKFHPAAEAQFNEAIAALEAINFGTGLNQYGFTGDYADYTSQAATIISGLKAQGYTEENLAVVQALLANYALNTNVPAGFYRITGNTSGKYLAAGFASNNKFAMTDAIDATTIFYFDGTKLTNFGSGMCNGMLSNAWAWVTGDNASTVTFQDGLTNGGYAIKSAKADGTNYANFYDNGDNSNSADRGGNLSIDANTNARYTSWYLTEITTLPVTITTAKWATLYAPIALTIPENVTVYYVSSLSDKEATLETITGTIPANTPVILYADVSENTSYNFVKAENVDAINRNQLSGSVLPITVEADEAYTLQKNVAGTAVGLFPKAAGTLAGFKAYLSNNASGGMNTAGVKGFTFTFDDLTTGINELDNSTIYNSTIYSLSGQRLSKPVKGINIVNGKKVLVK